MAAPPETPSAASGDPSPTDGITDPPKRDLDGAEGLDVLDALDAVGRSELDDDLGAAPSAPSSVRRPSRLASTSPTLSPNLLALYGTLIGLATVASLSAILIQVDPTPKLASLVGPRSGPAVAASAKSVSSAAAAAAPRPAPTETSKRIPGPWRIASLAGNGDIRIIKGTIGRDPFLKVLQSGGLDKSQAYAVLGAFKGLLDLDHCGAHDQFIAAVRRSTRQLVAFEYMVSKEEVYQARAGNDGRLAAKKLDLHVEREELAAAFTYDGKSIDKSAQTAGFGDGMYKALSDALSRHLDMDDLDRGDVFRVIAQEVTVLGEFSRYGGIEAVEYRPVKGEPSRYYYFKDSSGTASYYDANGKAPYNGGWRFPIEGGHVTSSFNLHRMHPILHRIMPHLGTDIGAPIGTPVHASSYGVVERLTHGGPTGNLVMLKHADGIETGYAHLVRYADGLKVGDHVKRWQVIGYVGSTGRSTGPHLHWIAKKDGKFFDAMKLKPDSLRVLPPEERTAFAASKAKYDAALGAIPLPPPLAGVAPAEPTPPPVQAPQPQASEVPPSAEEGDVGDTSSAAPPAPAAPANGSGPPKNAIYLTDKELLEMQSKTADGEVAR